MFCFLTTAKYTSSSRSLPGPQPQVLVDVSTLAFGKWSLCQEATPPFCLLPRSKFSEWPLPLLSLRLHSQSTGKFLGFLLGSISRI